jgi:hypothetical protein
MLRHASCSADNDSLFLHSRYYIFHCHHQISLETIYKNTPNSPESVGNMEEELLPFFPTGEAYPINWTQPFPDTKLANKCCWRRPLCKGCGGTFDTSPTLGESSYTNVPRIGGPYDWQINLCDGCEASFQNTQRIPDRSNEGDHIVLKYWKNGEICQLCFQRKGAREVKNAYRREYYQKNKEEEAKKAHDRYVAKKEATRVAMEMRVQEWREGGGQGTSDRTNLACDALLRQEEAKNGVALLELEPKPTFPDEFEQNLALHLTEYLKNN